MFRGKKGQGPIGPVIAGGARAAATAGRVAVKTGEEAGAAAVRAGAAVMGGGAPPKKPGIFSRILGFGWRKTTAAAAIGGTYLASELAKGAPSLTGYAKKAAFEMTNFSNIFVFLAILVAVGDIATDFTLPPEIRLFVYGLLWGFSWLLLWQERSIKTTLTSFLFSLAPFISPYLIKGAEALLPASSVVGRDVIVTVIVSFFSLFWLWALASKGQRFAKWIAIIVIFLVISSLVWQGAKLVGGILPEARVNNALERTTKAYKETITAIVALPNKTVEAYKRVINISAGNFETEVAKSIGEPLGVKIDTSKVRYGGVSILPDQTVTFFDNQKVEFWVPVEVVTRRDVTLRSFCRANVTEGAAQIGGGPALAVRSTGEKIIEQSEIRCSFAPGQLKPGENRITVGAEFEWQTDSYLLRYFLDRDWAIGQTRQGTDPLDTLRIADKRPATKTTPSPVELGIATTPQYIIAVSAAPEPTAGVPIVHFQLKRAAESQYGIGVIKNVTSLRVQLPEGIELNINSCDKKFISQGVISDGGYNYNVFALDASEKVENIKASVDFNCELKQPDASKLLAGNLAAFRTIRASSTYVFSAEKTVSINVRKS